MGMSAKADAFFEAMTTLYDIKAEIQRLSDERREILHALSEGHDPALVAERGRLEARIAELWDEYRAERARVRFGERELIIARARHEERLERAAA
jgi:ABC-type phosphate transport system auxiliary subunit